MKNKPHSFSGLRNDRRVPHIVHQFVRPLRYLLRDDFNDAQAAPLTSPRTCVPGPGTLTLLDPGARLSISGGVLQENGAGTDDNPSATYVESKSVGLVFLGTLRTSSVNGAYWYGANTATKEEARLTATSLLMYGAPGYTGGLTIGGLAPSTYYSVVQVYHIGRKLYFENTSGVYRLWFIANSAPTSSLVFGVGTRNSSDEWGCNTARVASLPGLRSDAVPGNGYEVFGHRDLDVTSSIATATDSDTFTFTKDFVASWTYTSVTVVNRYVRFNAKISVRMADNQALRISDTVGEIISLAPGVLTAGCSVTVQLVNTTLTAFIDGVKVGSATANLGAGFENLSNGAFSNSNSTLTNFSCKTLDGIYNSPWQSAEVLSQANDGIWDADNWASWSGGIGSNPEPGVLRVTCLAGDSSGSMRQFVLTVGKQYIIEGEVRTLNGGLARIYEDTRQVANIGGPADWTPFSVQFGCKTGDNIRLYTFTDTLDDRHSEWRNLSLKEVKEGYNSPNHPGYGLATDVLPGSRAVENFFMHEADWYQTWIHTPTVSGPVSVRAIDMPAAVSHLGVITQADGSLDIYQNVAGVGAYIATGSAGDVVAGDRITVIKDGTTVKVYINTTLKHTVTIDAALQNITGGKVNTISSGGKIENLVAWPRSFASAPNTPGAAEALGGLTALSLPGADGQSL